MHTLPWPLNELKRSLSEILYPSFKHSPIDSHANKIRLVKVLAAQKQDGLIPCEIMQASVGGATAYLAVSYVWGPAKPIRYISVNGKAFPIRQNLFNFLEAVQTTYWADYGNEWLWIDQLCIDQVSFLEKGHQVGRIGHIFASASKTIVWLGKCLAPDPQQVQRDANDTLFQWRHAKNPYWSRLWIVQEVIRSPQLVLCDSIERMKWSEFAENVRIMSTYEGPIGRRILDLATARTVCNPGSGGFLCLQDWRQVLALAADKECELGQDHVYGLVGLLREDLQVEVDYAKDVEEIYVDVALIVLRSENLFFSETLITDCRMCVGLHLAKCLGLAYGTPLPILAALLAVSKIRCVRNVEDNVGFWFSFAAFMTTALRVLDEGWGPKANLPSAAYVWEFMKEYTQLQNISGWEKTEIMEKYFSEMPAVRGCAFDPRDVKQARESAAMLVKRHLYEADNGSSARKILLATRRHLLKAYTQVGRRSLPSHLPSGFLNNPKNRLCDSPCCADSSSVARMPSEITLDKPKGTVTVVLPQEPGRFREIITNTF